ncbi:MAG TPA: hypothetical protein DCM08_06235 [Microscillaceae bacterium]|nr:hypothetical protein [Microscillaceae bacterium]
MEKVIFGKYTWLVVFAVAFSLQGCAKKQERNLEASNTFEGVMIARDSRCIRNIAVIVTKGGLGATWNNNNTFLGPVGRFENVILILNAPNEAGFFQEGAKVRFKLSDCGSMNPPCTSKLMDMLNLADNISAQYCVESIQKMYRFFIINNLYV